MGFSLRISVHLIEIPHDRIFVAEVARLREFSGVAEVAETSVSQNLGKFGYKNLITFSRGEFVKRNKIFIDI